MSESKENIFHLSNDLVTALGKYDNISDEGAIKLISLSKALVSFLSSLDCRTRESSMKLAFLFIQQDVLEEGRVDSDYLAEIKTIHKEFFEGRD